MMLEMDSAAEVLSGSRWFLGLAVLLPSFLVLVQSAGRLKIAPAYDDYRLSDEIYSGAGEWRKPRCTRANGGRKSPSRRAESTSATTPSMIEMAARDFSNSPVAGLALAAATFIVWSSAWAAEGTAESVNWAEMSMGLFGGLALFLFGMEQMSDALKSALGEQMKSLLARLTSNRFTGALTGAAVTAVVQSSSVTTVLVVGFVSAGMMSMSQSIGVIMGANVGTTITAQIVAFKVEEAALWMIAIGFLTMFTAKAERLKYYGTMLMGLA